MKDIIFYKARLMPRNHVCFLLLLVMSNLACKKITPEYISGNIGPQEYIYNVSPPPPGESPVTDSLPSDELVIWRKPDRDYKAYEKWRDSISKKGKVIQINPCGSCDNSLVVLKGEGIRNYIMTGGTVSGGQVSDKKSPPTGEDGPVYVSRNFRVHFARPGNSSNSYSPPHNSNYSGKPVKVAVFDTGIEPRELTNFMFNSSRGACIRDADEGWNFIKSNSHWKDDNDIRHGTVVTRFITNQVLKYGRNRVEVLPVKTHNKNGVSDLARILCAFAYAKERGVKIINASFGFYLPRQAVTDSLDPNARLFREFIRHYLTKNGILLVAAAGNTDDINERAAFELENIPYPKDPRNMDYAYFLPASLAQSESFQNVIAVTTVDQATKTVSPNQNYSKNTVDIGVDADAIIPDKILGDHYVFNHPLLNKNQTVEGSSFAAPIVTGILSANYDKFKHLLQHPNFKKADIWKELNKIVKSEPGLKKKIKDGRYVKK